MTRYAVRYSTERANLNVRDMLLRTGVLRKDAATAIGISESQFSQKLRSIRNRFTVEEFGKLASYFTHVTGKPLTGWPFVDEQLSDLIDAGLKGQKRPDGRA